uniref:Uncharacterized protein n=1 Tax=Panagrolaimus superbus TaxID=310955 RepID=A0A914YRW8_9BILA
MEIQHESRWKIALRQISQWKIQVEPIIFVLSLCNAARSVVSPHLMEEKMKRTYFPSTPLSPSELKKFYNKKIVLWDQNYEYVNLPIACLAGIVYGSYSDQRGRKLPLLIGLFSVIIDNIFYMLIWSEKTDISLQWLFLGASIVGLMGDFMLLMSCVNAYLADQFGNKRTLSIRMILVSTIFSLGSFCGSQTVDHLVDVIGGIGTMFVVQGALIITFILSILILTNPLPMKQQNLNDDADTEAVIHTEAIEAEEIQQPSQSFYKAVIEKFQFLFNSIKIFYIPREGHRRLFLYACFAANFLDQLVFGEEKGLIGKYTLLDPFNWSTHEYARYKEIRPILRDTFIIVLAIASMSLSTLVIGLAKSSALIYASLAPGSLHGLLNPLTYTFITCLVEPSEIGQTFAISTIAGKLAGIVQTAVLDTLYRITVEWYQGFVWLVMFLISAIAAFLYLIIHIIAKKEDIGT